ncbi:hypothetical protein BpHYR1_023274 [Brachionus plicatilis]|uniref:Uncharacterized protein n=1 Tax=Brachionus plicatilis TaxID=10195 RepID=A0A3M7Q579_BRAPC|nr:hypothetical protein BpHYR1_023274 [Brachionus plicatilis]
MADRESAKKWKRLEKTIHLDIKNSPLVLILRLKGFGLKDKKDGVNRDLIVRLMIGSDSVYQGYKTVEAQPETGDAFLTKALILTISAKNSKASNHFYH